MKKYIANIITSLRILCSILLLFFPLFSWGFYIVYFLCGFSDMIDGSVARKTNSNSGFGAKFDTIADFIFMTVALFKLLPTIHVPQWLWIWVIAIAVIKISNIVWGFIQRGKLISIHTILNKVTGLVLFLLPLMMQFIELKYSYTIICSIATLSAIQEGYYIRIGCEIE